MTLHIETPLAHSLPLSMISHKHVWLKYEALQPSGSFKLRGIGALCEAYATQGKTRFISSSGGNAGIAVAYTGRQLGIPVTVVVPETTTARAKALIAQEGANVITHGASWAEANTRAQALLDDPSVAFIHPFDDPTIWDGHATMIDEIARSHIVFDSIILSVGGGGLLSGVVAGMQRNGLSHLPVITVETYGADSLFQIVEKGRHVELEAISSIATSLGAKKVCENAFQATSTFDIRCARVHDSEALDACERFLDDHRILVEPACGAALAAVYHHHESLLSDVHAPLVIVCGGVTASIAQIRDWKQASTIIRPT